MLRFDRPDKQMRGICRAGKLCRIKETAGAVISKQKWNATE
jgi:hypothetical protein